LATVRVEPTCGDPPMLGGVELLGPPPIPTSGVVAEVAWPLPELFVAVTITSSVAPTSPAWTV
jgi:hypothetical protein